MLAILTLAIYAMVLGWSFVGHQHLIECCAARHAPLAAGIAPPGADAHDPASCPVCAFARGSNARISMASPAIEVAQAATPVCLYVTAAPRVPFAAPTNPRAPPAA